MDLKESYLNKPWKIETNEISCWTVYNSFNFIFSFHCRLTQYGNRCNWLKDDRFLRDLEGDSVDTEILDEELRSLQDDEPKT